MKNNFNYPLYYSIQWTWGIIQNILGFFLYVVVMCISSNREIYRYQGSKIIYWDRNESVSLGTYIFLGRDDHHTIAHEYGHSIQSCILGPFYLIVVGIPSFIWCNSKIFKKMRKDKHISYYSFYPEKWANYLGKKYTGETI